jgi:hypothetical protein
MRVMTRVVVSGAVALMGLAGLQVFTGWPGERPRSSSQEMAKPRKLKVPDEQDRAVVAIQVCWYPSTGNQMLLVPWSLGTEPQQDVVGPPLTCQTPWMRSAKVRRGDRIMVGWILSTGTISKFQARVTVNNRQAMYALDAQNRLKLECVAGVPPCWY